MAKKNQQKRSKVKQNTESLREIKHLQTLIKYSKRAMERNTSDSLKDLFMNQIAKIESQLNKIQGKQ